MSSFDGSLTFTTGWKWIDGSVEDRNSQLSQPSIGDGSGSAQADGSWNITSQVLASGATKEYDLTALSRTLFGGPLSYEFSRVISIQIASSSTASTGDLLIGGAASNAFTGFLVDTSDKLLLQPGSSHLLSGLGDGWTVSGTDKVIKLEASGGDVTYSIALMGNVIVNSGS